jgi:molecular chaperone HtpG
MVASKVEVQSKKAGEDKSYKWVSSGGAEYDISESDKKDQGTTITLYLKDEEGEFLESHRIESIITKYSNHIPFPIFLEKVEKKDDDKTEITNEQINKASALWRLNKSEIKKDEYNEFYKSISHDSEDPILHIHTKAEGKIEYSTLFYVPKTAPFDMYRVDYQSGIKLYVKRVFITDDDKDLLPTYLRFIRGIIDVEDLPLNVSRELLQQNVILAQVKKASVKKILSELKKLKNKDFDKYKEFYATFGKVLKEGIMSEYEHRDLLLDLLLFKSSKRDELITLEQYKEDMKEDQKEIYYITGESESMLRNSPLIEGFKEKDIEVLILDDEVDTIVIPNVGQYKETPLVAANSVSQKGDEDAVKAKTEEFAEILVKMKEELKDEVKDVKISSRLKKSPTVLVYDKDDPDFAMQQMMKQMGQGMDLPPVKPILEINADHEIFTKMLEKKDYVSLVNLSHVMLDLAKLNEGMKIEDSAGFADRVNALIAGSL